MKTYKVKPFNFKYLSRNQNLNMMLQCTREELKNTQYFIFIKNLLELAKIRSELAKDKSLSYYKRRKNKDKAGMLFDEAEGMLKVRGWIN